MTQKPKNKIWVWWLIGIIAVALPFPIVWMGWGWFIRVEIIKNASVEQYNTLIKAIPYILAPLWIGFVALMIRAYRKSPFNIDTLRGGMMFVIIFCACGLPTMFMFLNWSKGITPNEMLFPRTLNPELVNTAIDVCSGNSVTGVAPYDPASAGPHPLYYINMVNEQPQPGVERIDSLPEDWIATSQDELQLVACVDGPRQEDIEHCHYFGGKTITRTRSTANVLLIIAATGEAVFEEEFVGPNPDGCPESTTGGSDISGDPLDFSIIRDALEPFIMGSASGS